MMAHHIITVFLMVASYYGNLTRVGCLIMVLMDCCDIWLPVSAFSLLSHSGNLNYLQLAKMLRYIAFSQLVTDITFGIFLVSWFISRHALFMCAIISQVRDSPKYIKFSWNPEEGHYYSEGAYRVYCSLLIALQVGSLLKMQSPATDLGQIVTSGPLVLDDLSGGLASPHYQQRGI